MDVQIGGDEKLILVNFITIYLPLYGKFGVSKAFSTLYLESICHIQLNSLCLVIVLCYLCPLRISSPFSFKHEPVSFCFDVEGERKI